MKIQTLVLDQMPKFNGFNQDNELTIKMVHLYYDETKNKKRSKVQTINSGMGVLHFINHILIFNR